MFIKDFSLPLEMTIRTLFGVIFYKNAAAAEQEFFYEAIKVKAIDAGTSRD
ncbi:MAG: hypothetical protein KGY61_11025 [Desulfobacterales bacterium]|nr:hypothetical protein [Desulfobacterales bacterium]